MTGLGAAATCILARLHTCTLARTFDSPGKLVGVCVAGVGARSGVLSREWIGNSDFAGGFHPSPYPIGFCLFVFVILKEETSEVILQSF